MADHQGLPVAGYKPQSDDNIKLVNYAKELEERCLRHIDALAQDPHTDKRMAAIARTELQSAFMWANRAVFKPGRVSLPEDKASA